MSGQWAVRAVSYVGSNKRWDQQYQLQKLGYPGANIWLGSFIDGFHVAQWNGEVLWDRTYTGLRGGAVLLGAGEANTHVYAVYGTDTSSYHIDRLPVGGSAWEAWDPNPLPDSVSWDQRGPFIFNGALYAGVIMLNQPEMPFSAGRAKTLWKIPLDDAMGNDWTRVYYEYMGFFNGNNHHSIGYDGVEYVSVGRREQGPVDATSHGASLDSMVSTAVVTGLTKVAHSYAFPALLNDGSLVFQVDNTEDGYGFNVTPDHGAGFSNLTPDISIGNVTGRYNVSSNGEIIAFCKKPDIFNPSGQVVYGPPTGVGWQSLSSLGIESGQSIFWDAQGQIFFLAHDGVVSILAPDLSAVFLSVPTAPLGWEATFDCITALPASMVW